MSVEKFTCEPEYISLERKGTTGRFIIRNSQKEVVGYANDPVTALLFTDAPAMLNAMNKILHWVGNTPRKDQLTHYSKNRADFVGLLNKLKSVTHAREIEATRLLEEACQ